MRKKKHFWIMKGYLKDQIEIWMPDMGVVRRVMMMNTVSRQRRSSLKQGTMFKHLVTLKIVLDQPKTSLRVSIQPPLQDLKAISKAPLSPPNCSTAITTIFLNNSNMMKVMGAVHFLWTPAKLAILRRGPGSLI